MRDVSFAKMTPADWDSIHQVHLKGAFSVTRAAWPYFREQKFGRVINTASAAGLYGNVGQANYSAAKLGLVGLASTLAKEGAKLNIHANTIAPLAASRMTETVLPPDFLQNLKPDFVAPLVMYLCHENTKENGSVFEVGAGWVAKVRWQRSAGHSFPVTEGLTPEKIASQFKSITDFSNPSYPTSPQDSFAPIVANMSKSGVAAKAPKLQQQKPAAAGGASAKIFAELAKRIAAEPDLSKKFNCSYRFDVGAQSVLVDLKSTPGSVKPATADTKADCILILSEENFIAMMTGKLNPQTAFMKQQLKIKGNMMLSQKLGQLIKPAAKL